MHCLTYIFLFLGSSVPSAFVLFVMRELPPLVSFNTQRESTTIAFISDRSVAIHPRMNETGSRSQVRHFCLKILCSFVTLYDSFEALFLIFCNFGVNYTITLKLYPISRDRYTFDSYFEWEIESGIRYMWRIWRWNELKIVQSIYFYLPTPSHKAKIIEKFSLARVH